MGKRKALAILIIATALFSAAVAQNIAATGDSIWREQYKMLYKEYAKNTSDVAANVALAEFYSNTDNPMCNFATAMRHITLAEKKYVELVEKNENHKEISRLIKKKITVVAVRQKKSEIIGRSIQLLESDKTLSEGILNNYAEAFKGNADIMKLVEKRRLQSRYQQAMQSNTLSALHQFLNNYPGTLEAEKAAEQMGLIATKTVVSAQRENEVDSLLMEHLDIPEVQRAATTRKSAVAFAILKSNPTLSGYKSFMQRYPGSNEYSMAIQAIEESSRQEFAKLTTAREFADFAINNPDNPLAEKAEERLKKMITEERDMEALKIYMEEFPLDVNYNDIYLDYFKWHTEEGNLAPIALFAKENPDFPHQIALFDALSKAEHIDSINIMEPFNERDFRNWASKVYHLTGKKVSYVALQRTLQHFIAAKNWPKALERISFFDLSFEDNCIDEVAELRAILEAPSNPKTAIQPSVRPAYNMLHPVLHPDGNHLFYNKVVDGIITIQSAERVAAGKGIVWKSTGDIPFSNTSNRDIYIYSFYDNGNKMLVGRDGDIMSARFENDMWHLDQPFPQPVNSDANDFDAVMLPDGSGMLLASDRRGGQNLQPSGSYFHGDTALASDIYFVPRTNKGWGKAINLGINVNSPYMECSPAISKDLKTLYFITDGRGGLGYGDIYYTTRDNTENWRSWTKPRNYGKDANSGFNEKSATLSDDGNTLYVSSNATGRYGCYTLASMKNIENGMNTVTVNSPNIGITIDVVNCNNAEIVANNIKLERDTTLNSSFYSDRTYLLLCNCSGTYIPGVLFTPNQNITITPIVYDANTVINKTIDLGAIQFDESHSTISAASAIELEHLSAFMKAHPHLKAEIGVHVSGNDDTYCFNLSQARATEIKKQLALKGIDKDRIAVAIYGNSITKKGKHGDGATIFFKF